MRLVQGSHIVVRKLYEHNRCYSFQNPDGGIFFAIPYGALPELARKGSWTATAALPGGEFPVEGAAALAPSLRREYPFLDERRAWRLVRHYGAEARTMLGARRSDADCGRDFGGDLTEAEDVV